MSHKKPFSIFRTMHLSYVKQISKQTTPTVKNCVCLNALFCLKNKIFEFFSTQIFAMKVDESTKIIFYLTQRGPLSRYVKFQSHDTNFSRRCLLKHVVFFKEQHFYRFWDNFPSPEENSLPTLILTLAVNQTLNLNRVQFPLGSIVRTPFSYFWVFKYSQ